MKHVFFTLESDKPIPNRPLMAYLAINDSIATAIKDTHALSKNLCGSIVTGPFITAKWGDYEVTPALKHTFAQAYRLTQKEVSTLLTSVRVKKFQMTLESIASSDRPEFFLSGTCNLNGVKVELTSPPVPLSFLDSNANVYL